MIWGIGPGCCATKTVARLLDGVHEYREDEAEQDALTMGPEQLEDKCSAIFDEILERGVPAISHSYSVMISMLRRIDPEAYFVILMRAPTPTLECFARKGIFQDPDPGNPYFNFEPGMPRWAPLNHWVWTMRTFFKETEGRDDWEAVWVQELPRAVWLNVSDKSKKGFPWYLRLLIWWTTRKIIRRMINLHVASIVRGRPVLEQMWRNSNEGMDKGTTANS